MFATALEFGSVFASSTIVELYSTFCSKARCLKWMVAGSRLCARTSCLFALSTSSLCSLPSLAV